MQSKNRQTPGTDHLLSRQRVRSTVMIIMSIVATMAVLLVLLFTGVKPSPTMTPSSGVPVPSVSSTPEVLPTETVMRTFSITASDHEIKALVVEWTDLLAEKRYRDALTLLPYSTEQWPWTPELLERTIAGYGYPDPDPEVIKAMREDWGVTRFEVTTLSGRPDKDAVMRDHIAVNRHDLFGLDPSTYSGMVHFNALPLCGSLSDITARFYIKKVGADRLTLEFIDIHVM